MKMSPYVVLVFGVLVVSTAAILFKLAPGENIAVLMATGRLGFAAVVLLPIAGLKARGQIKALSLHEWRLMVVAGAFLAVHFASWFASLEYTSVVSSTALVTTTPIWVGVASWLLWRERMSRTLVVGIVIAALGSILIGISDGQLGQSGSNPLLGDILALVGALCAAGYFLAGTAVRKHVDLLPYITIAYTTGAVVLVVWSLIAGFSFSGQPTIVYVLMLGLALGPQLLGHTSLNWALRYISPTFVTIAVLGEPVGSSVLALVMLQQVPTLLQIVGGLVVLVGIFIATLKPRRPTQVEPML